MLHSAHSETDHLLNNVLGLIPARGGSKSIPRKNIVPLGGRPLLAYTCEAALKSRLLSRVVLSTDDHEIAEVGHRNGVEVPFLRPQELARDDTPSLAVVQHALRWLMMHDDWQAGVVVLLQPTSPLRQSHQIDEAIERLKATGADTVVSVIEVPHKHSPYSIMQLKNGYLEYFWKRPTTFNRLRRQELPTLYARNGPAILASRVEVVLDGNKLCGEKTIPYQMSEEDSVDIDTPFDLQIAEWLLGVRATKV